MSILRRRPGAEHPRRVPPPARLHGKALAGSVSSAPRRCRGLLALLTLVQHHRRQTDLRHGGRGAQRRWQTAARPDHKSKTPEKRNTTRDETSCRQRWGGTSWGDTSAWTVTASPRSPLHQHSTSLPTAGASPGPCPGSRQTRCQRLPRRREGEFGLRVAPRPPGPPASACAWQLHQAGALQGVKPHHHDLCVAGMRESVRPRLVSARWGQPGRRWVTPPGGTVPTPPRPRGAVPRPGRSPAAPRPSPQSTPPGAQSNGNLLTRLIIKRFVKQYCNFISC